MRSVISPRKVIDAFERDHPGLSVEDKQFLKRLRSERFAHEVATAWRYIRTADVEVIECAVRALRVAKALPKLPAVGDKHERDLKAVKESVHVLRHYFAEYKGAEADELRRGLAWAREFSEPSDEHGLRIAFAGWLTETEAIVASNSPSENIPQLRRNYRTLAAQRSTFMVQVRQAMRTIFGRPCDAAVAALTTVAFEVEVLADHVRNAWNRSIRRKK